MKNYVKPTFFSLSLCSAALLASLPSAAEDTDIFKPAQSNAAAPKILIVLDNTSNWARQSQQWPGGLQQGQSEANAIKTVLGTFDSTTKVNMGLMEFVTNGNANDNGGFIRYAMRDMSDATNRTAFSTKLTTIYNNITSPNEKRNSNTPYGNLMYDVYNYFAGANSYWGSTNLPNPDADPAGYSTTYSQFNSPLSAAESCAKTYVIFIGNPNASGPASDDQANTNRLSALGGDTSELPLPGVATSTVVSDTVSTLLGNTSQCYASIDAANAAYGYGLNSNSIDKICKLYSAQGSALGSVTDSSNPPTSCTSYSGLSGEAERATATDFKSACATFTQGCKLGGTANNPAQNLAPVPGTTGYLATAPAATAADAGAKAGLTCPANAISCTFTVEVASTASMRASDTGDTTNCYYTGNGSNPDNVSQWTASTNDYGNLTTDCGANSPYTCSYLLVGSTQSASCTQRGNVKKATLQRTFTPNSTYKVTMYATVSGGTCPANTNQYQVLGINLVQSNVVGTSTIADTKQLNADEWARLLFQKGVQISTDNSGNAIRQPVAVYTIDVYNKQPNALHTALLMEMSKVGGGKYFAAKSEDEIVAALKNILVEIQAVNSTFASASLPVNATNRAQNENQVFIGMFRPDSKPRWFGNLKRYQLINKGGNIELGDNSSPPIIAVNTNTGFVTDCAISFWTTDSGSYWQTVNDGSTPPISQLLDPNTIKGKCSGYNAYSDLPDGPLVEKGAVAEVLRKGNNSSGTTTWSVNRTIYTRSGNSLVTFNTTNSGLSSNLVNFISGFDVNNEKGSSDAATSATQTRPSIHGDVVHSRPLPINYGAGAGVVVYYGANDGTLRAVEAGTGKEKWAFIAPEFLDSSRLTRLMMNSPNNHVPAVFPNDGNNKDYYFDGSIGFYQNANNSKVWIFPTMRRGGRMIYALDVINPDSPTLKWAVGCPNLGNDTGCTTGMSGIGQTWSIPRGTRIKGYSQTDPVIIVGGGYDACEDENSKTPSCGDSSKGREVYVLKASDGSLIKSFTFPSGRSLAADVTPIDVDADGYADYAYAADTAGNIYRIDFINFDKTTRTPDQWTARRVAYTNGDPNDNGRKFLFGPAVFTNGGKAYLALGSGDREHPLQSQYPFNNVVNRFYVYKDDLSVTAIDATPVNLDTMKNLTTPTTCSDPSVLPDSADIGWFMNLNQYGQGEQTVTSALIAGGMVNFSTNRPVNNPNSCNAQLGEARGYAVNLFNASGGVGVSDACGGPRSGVFAGGGLPPSPVQAIVPINGKNVAVCIGCPTESGNGNSVIDPSPLKYLVQPKRKRIYSYIRGDN